MVKTFGPSFDPLKKNSHFFFRKSQICGKELALPSLVFSAVTSTGVMFLDGMHLTLTSLPREHIPLETLPKLLTAYMWNPPKKT